VDPGLLSRGDPGVDDLQAGRVPQEPLVVDGAHADALPPGRRDVDRSPAGQRDLEGLQRHPVPGGAVAQPFGDAADLVMADENLVRVPDGGKAAGRRA